MSHRKTAISRKPTRQRSPQHRPRTAKSDWLIVGILLLGTIVAFWRVCAADFTNWDDPGNVSKNPYLNPVTPDGVLYFWQHAHMSIYIPFTYTVWGALASIARLDNPENGIWLNPWIFHTGNLLVHLAAVLLAYQLLNALTRNKWASGAGALLFALHPVQVESVAWVAGMKDVLCGAFCLAALWQYVLYAQKPQRRLHYAIATIAFALALLSKPSAVALPLAAAVIDRLLIGRDWKRIVLALLPWIGMAIACAIVARIVQYVVAPADGGRLWLRPLLAGDALAFYVLKIIWPAHLVVQYHASPRVLLNGKWIWFAWIIPAAIAIIALLFRKRAPWLLAGCLLLAIATLPVLGLVPFEFERLSLVADHYLYLAMIGPALLLAFALSRIHFHPVVTAACAIVLTALAVRTFLQTAYWHDTISLFDHELAINPDSEIAYNNLADRALADGNVQQAEALARRSIAVQPNHPDAYVTLGIALTRQKSRTSEALAAYQKAVDLAPSDPIALNNFGGLLAQQGHIDQALPLIQKALVEDPLSAAAHRNLAVMLANQGKIPEALEESRLAVRLDPLDPDGQVNFASLLAMTGHRAEAIEHTQEALRLQPDSPKAQQLMAALAR